MYSKSYRDGLDGNLINTGGSFIDYENGRMDRERQYGGGGSGGNGLGLLIIVIVVIPFAIICLISSLFISLLLKFYLRKEDEIKNFSFKSIYIKFLKITALYQLLSIPFGFLLFFISAYLLSNTNLFWQPISDLNYFVIEKNNLIDLFYFLPFLFLILAPAVLLNSYFLSKQFNDISKFRGKRGYWNAVFFTGIIITPIIFLVSTILLEVYSKFK